MTLSADVITYHKTLGQVNNTTTSAQLIEALMD